MSPCAADDGKRFAIVSPHFDDAVLSCGAFLASHPGSTVITVFSGRPTPSQQTDWDSRCGFSDSDTAVQARVAENNAALDCLQAQSINLGLVDDQYSTGDDAEQLCAELSGALSRLAPDTVIIPLGLFHKDHIKTSDTALAIATRNTGRHAWFAYSEALYRLKTGLVQSRLAQLLERDIAATPVWFNHNDAEHHLKTRAVASYASQLKPLGLVPGRADDAAPECYWRLNWVSEG